MKNLKLYLSETETEKQSDFQIRKLENSIFGGTQSLKFALSFIKNAVKDSDNQTQKLFDETYKAYLKLNSGFLNRMASNEIFWGPLKDWIQTEKNPTFKNFFSNLENNLNDAVIKAKRPDTKTNRLKDKKAQLDFWKSNQTQVDNLLLIKNNMSKLEDIILEKRPKVIKESLHIPTSTLNIARNLMPQIQSKDIPEFIHELTSKGIKVIRTKIRADKLKFAQGEFNHEKVSGMMKKDLSQSKPIIVSKDDYVIDGNHRALAELNKNRKSFVDSILIDLNIMDLIQSARQFDKVFYKQIHEQIKLKKLKTIVKESHVKL